MINGVIGAKITLSHFGLSEDISSIVPNTKIKMLQNRHIRKSAKIGNLSHCHIELNINRFPIFSLSLMYFQSDILSG